MIYMQFIPTPTKKSRVKILVWRGCTILFMMFRNLDFYLFPAVYVRLRSDEKNGYPPPKNGKTSTRYIGIYFLFFIFLFLQKHFLPAYPINFSVIQKCNICNVHTQLMFINYKCFNNLWKFKLGIGDSRQGRNI